MQRPSPPLDVLLIEDEALLIMDLQYVIEDMGHRVVADVGSPEELKLLALPSAPHIAFVDVQLSKGTSGLDASALVRDRWANTSIVFITANPGKIPVGYVGSYGVISKPFSEKGLIASLRFLTQAICSPPPSMDRPSNFTAFPALELSWTN